MISLELQRHEPLDTTHLGPAELPESAEVDLFALVLGRDEYGRAGFATPSPVQRADL